MRCVAVLAQTIGLSANVANINGLNLSNSVAITLFEVWRQQGFSGDAGQSIGYDNLVPYDPK